MSLIPLDDRRGEEQPTPPEGPQRGGVGGLFERVRSLLAGIADRLGWADDDEIAALPDEAIESGETVNTLTTNLQLVSSENDGTLTVTDADNPDATITSDTWEPVER